MHTGVLPCPSQPENADDEAWTANHSAEEPLFWWGKPSPLLNEFWVMYGGVNINNRTDSGANPDTNEDEATLSDAETSLLDKDDREGFEYCTT